MVKQGSTVHKIPFRGVISQSKTWLLYLSRTFFCADSPTKGSLGHRGFYIEGCQGHEHSDTLQLEVDSGNGFEMINSSGLVGYCSVLCESVLWWSEHRPDCWSLNTDLQSTTCLRSITFHLHCFIVCSCFHKVELFCQWLKWKWWLRLYFIQLETES